MTWPVTVSASSSRTCWPWPTWSAEARFVATVVLPTPPFGLKTAITVARRCQAPSSDRAGLDHRARAVVDGHRPDAHRLDPPAERVRRVRPGEELVAGVGPGRARGHRVEGPRRQDHERRDRRGPRGGARSTRARCRGRSRRRGSRRRRRGGSRGATRARPDAEIAIASKPAIRSSAITGPCSDDGRATTMAGRATGRAPDSRCRDAPAERRGLGVDQSSASGSWAVTWTHAVARPGDARLEARQARG